MSGQGRPLRFLGLVAFAWIGARVAILWPQTGSLPQAIREAVPIAAAAPRPYQIAPVKRSTPPRMAAREPIPTPPVRRAAPATAAWLPPDPLRVQIALFATVQYGAPIASGWPQGPVLAAPPPDRLPPLASGWSGSAWLVARPPGAGEPAGPGQLGGSQMGARLAYMLEPRARLALVGRVAAPLDARGREAALGLEWQPSRAPIRVAVEQRFGLDGQPGGPAAGVIAGVDASLSGFRIEGYGQAGAVHRRRVEPYADGSLRATRAVSDGDLRLAFGLGGWGGAQRGIGRLDLGPSATLAVPVGRTHLRLALDWRARVAGNAAPGSGPALSLGSDF